MLPRIVSIWIVAACSVFPCGGRVDAADGADDDADVKPMQPLPDRFVVSKFQRRVGGPNAWIWPRIDNDFEHAEKVDEKTLWWVNERQRFDKMVLLEPNVVRHLPANVRQRFRTDPCAMYETVPERYHALYALGEGYVAPFFGKLYRVEKSDGETFTLQAPRPEDLPRWAVVDPDSFAFPTATLVGYIATVRAHPDVCDRDDQGPFADLTCYRDPTSIDFAKKNRVEIPIAPGEMVFGDPHAIRLRPGEYLEAPQCGLYRVRRVVPFDREARIWGWIEFDPLPTVPKTPEERAKLVVRRPVRK